MTRNVLNRVLNISIIGFILLFFVFIFCLRQQFSVRSFLFISFGAVIVNYFVILLLVHFFYKVRSMESAVDSRGSLLFSKKFSTDVVFNGYPLDGIIVSLYENSCCMQNSDGDFLLSFDYVDRQVDMDLNDNGLDLCIRSYYDVSNVHITGDLLDMRLLYGAFLYFGANFYEIGKLEGMVV